uniref:NADH-ubiquinone oxidoreductase chain 1 n=1 Tax=Laqueus rubellus TaxID=93892 RepID=Q9MQZ0_LAQRU|nr:NADH dehydrogenase subunit 1 [Laqueus rubellus]BAA95927.1 NADH dehydrogenase subunit 1 [Laqueus rubellus]
MGVVYSVMVMVPILLAMAFFTLTERKILGYIQIRKGPNKVGYAGVLQPFLDAVKLLAKEMASPMYSSWGFFVAPGLALSLALLMWVNYYSVGSVHLGHGALFFLCVSSLSVYPVFMAGWASNSKYALLGAVRSVAQTISYEVTMVLVILMPLCLFMVYDFLKMPGIPWGVLLFPPILVMWVVTSLAETNRAPFDFAEGESELVSGFNIEYGGAGFALIFMGEYISIIFLSFLTSILFLGSYLLWVKVGVITFCFVWVRGALPRLRYDLLMGLTWKCYLPVTLSVLIPECIIIYSLS